MAGGRSVGDARLSGGRGSPGARRHLVTTAELYRLFTDSDDYVDSIDVAVDDSFVLPPGSTSRFRNIHQAACAVLGCAASMRTGLITPIAECQRLRLYCPSIQAPTACLALAFVAAR